MSAITEGLYQNWPVWVVSITLVVAAVIDGIKLKVPNWITFPMIHVARASFVTRSLAVTSPMKVGACQPPATRLAAVDFVLDARALGLRVFTRPIMDTWMEHIP